MGNNLSKTQQEAVECLQGPLQIISCPGSGKTTVIVHRANNLIKNGVNGRNILVITFAVDAAKSMKERYLSLFGNDGIIFSTMHSICFNILKYEYGIKSENILDEKKQKDYFISYLKKLEVMNPVSVATTLMGEISYIKNRQISYLTYTSVLKTDLWIKAYEDYLQYKNENELMDFDDLLVETKELFEANEEVLNGWRNKYRYLMIDEFQDTNSLQADIFYMLAKYHRNICIVGDDDQSIYGFRAAESKIMLNFANEFPETKTVYMTTNYRSCEEVVLRSKVLINNNEVRFQKDIEAFNKKPGIVKLMSVPNPIAQSEDIVELMQELKEKEGVPYEEMAVLYRTHSENIFVAGMLATRQIPFTSKDMVYEYHKTLPFKIIESYYRISRNREKKDDLRSIINFPNRYLRADYFKDIPFDKKILMRKAMQCQNKDAAAKAVLEFISDVERLSKTVEPKDFVKVLFQDMKLRESLIDFGEYSHMDVDMLKQSMQLIETEAHLFGTMEDWFAYAQMQKETVAKSLKDKHGVTLSTMHGSKGLEWNTVFIINCNEGVVPSEMAIQEDNIEEERRLFYVAMTRAKERLYLCNISERAQKSRFLTEIGM